MSRRGGEDRPQAVLPWMRMPVRRDFHVARIAFQDEITWLLSDNGIWVLKDGAVQRVDTGDFNASVERMAVDYQGNLWFASSKQGLMQLSETIFPNLNIPY